jgi:hypothetical protein
MAIEFKRRDYSQPELTVEKLVGQTFDSVYQEDVNLLFFRKGNQGYLMHHEQDCCEDVAIEEIVGDLADLVGAEILEAREDSNNTYDDENESQTWTFYNLRTAKGYVTIRWYGTSNGYYSESVNLSEVIFSDD